MQLTLQMVGVCLLLDSNKQAEDIGAGLGQQLADLAAQISDVQEKVSVTIHSQISDKDTLVSDVEDIKQRKEHIENYIDSAKIIYSNASIYNGSVNETIVENSADVANMTGTFRSVLGLNDDQRQRVNQWLPDEEKIEEDVVDNNDGPDSSLFEARLAIARKRFEDEDYKAATTQFRVCLKDDTVIKTLPVHDIVDIKLEFASACRGSGNATEQQAILLELLDFDLPKLQICHLQHILALAYLDDQRLELAREYADKAMKGRKRILGGRHELYYESISLLVDVLVAQNNLDDADVYRHLLPPGFRKDTTMYPAAPSHDLASIKLLAQNGFDIHKKETCFEALNWAIDEKQKAVVRLSLERGSDINGKDKWRNTMLIYACQYGFADIVSQLIARGADVNVISNRGTPLYYALDNKEIVSLLISHGADLEAKEEYGNPVLLEVASIGHVARIITLLDLGANIEATGIIGYSVLQLASVNGQTAAVRILLERGADPNARRGLQSSALHIACERGHETIVRMLLEKGANVHAKDSKKQTALDFAKQGNHSEIVRLLKSKRGGIFRR